MKSFTPTPLTGDKTMKNCTRLFAAALLLAVLPPAVAHADLVTALNPTADTQISSSASTTPQGSNTTMDSNRGATSNVRWSYVRFDLSAINIANVTNIDFNVRNNGAGGAVVPIGVFGLLEANDDWDESLLTYSNDANRTGTDIVTANVFGGTTLANFSAMAGAGIDHAFDVSSGPVFNFINNDTDKIVTFVLYDTGTTPQGIRWETRESGSAANRPTLNLTVAPTPAALPAGLAMMLAFAARRRRRA